MKKLMAILLMLASVSVVAAAEDPCKDLQSVRAKRRDAALAEYARGKSIPQQPAVVETPVAEPVIIPEVKEQAPAVVEQQVTEPTIVPEVKEQAPTVSAAPLEAPLLKEEPPAEVQPAPAASEALPEFENPEQRTWGSFPEVSFWTGAWKNFEHDTWGVWGNLKWLQWFTRYEKAENFGIGASLRGDYGAAPSGADWGYYALGPHVGYYRGLGLRNSFEADMGILWRFDMNRKDGVMLTPHVQFDHILNHKNRLTLQVDGSIFDHDSFVGPGIFWEHKLNKDYKVISGAGASIGFLDGDIFTGFAPSIRVKYKNRFSLGLTANLFTGLGPFGGIIAAYEATPDITTWYAEKRAKTIQKKETPVGKQSAKPAGIQISSQTIDQMEH